MLFRTHIAVAIFFILLFLSKVEHRISFVLILFAAAVIPDVDTRFSKVGKKKIFRLLQFFVKHRGLFHSFLFLIFITLILVLFVPVISLPFFLGYSSHLMMDSFTIEGVYPFYPLKKRIFGSIKTGGKNEIIFLIIITLICVAMIIAKVFGVS
jgi:inner membrane protein